MLRLAPRRQGGDRRGVRRGGARHQARPRQQPADPQRDGAARGGRRLRFAAPTRITLYTTSQNPHVARLVLSRVRRHSAGEQAARHRARRRRRLRLEDLHLRRGDGLHLGGAGRSTGRSNGPPTAPRLPVRRARPRPRHPRRNGARRRRQDHWRCACTRSPISAPISRPSRRWCRPISMRRCCRAYTTSRHLRRGRRRSSPTPCRSTPIAAPGGPEATFLVERLVEVAARETGARSGRVPAHEFHHRVSRIRRRSSCNTTAATIRDARQGDGARGLQGLRRAQSGLGARASCAASASPPISRPAASRRRARSARSARGVGGWESAEVRVNPTAASKC